MDKRGVDWGKWPQKNIPTFLCSVPRQYYSTTVIHYCRKHMLLLSICSVTPVQSWAKLLKALEQTLDGLTPEMFYVERHCSALGLGEQEVLTKSCQAKLPGWAQGTETHSLGCDTLKSCVQPQCSQLSPWKGGPGWSFWPEWQESLMHKAPGLC